MKVSSDICNELNVSVAWICKYKRALGIPIGTKGEKKHYTDSEYTLLKQKRLEKINDIIYPMSAAIKKEILSMLLQQL